MKPETQKARIPQGQEPDWRKVPCPTCGAQAWQMCVIRLHGKAVPVAPHIDRHFYRENRPQ